MLSEKPDDKPAITMQIKALGRMGRIEDAESVFRAAIKHGLADGFVYGSMITAFSDSGRHGAAERLFEQASIAVPSAMHILYHAMIRSYGKAGRPEKAAEVFEAALREGAANQTVFCAMAEVHTEARDVAGAESLFEMAWKKSLLCPGIYYYMIDIYCRVCRLGDARRKFEDAVEEGHTNPELFRLMMKVNEQYGELDEAARVFEMARSMGMADGPTSSLGQHIYYVAGRFDEALSVFGSLPPEARQSPNVLIDEAEVLRKRKEYGKAVSILRGLLDGPVLTEDELHQTKTILAYALKDSGKLVESFFLFEQLVREMPVDSLHFPRVLCGFVFAWQGMRFGRLDEKTLDSFLEILGHSKRTARENLLHDIEDAIAVIEHYYKLCKNSKA